jgi:hypothetical protein
MHRLHSLAVRTVLRQHILLRPMSLRTWASAVPSLPTPDPATVAAMQLTVSKAVQAYVQDPAQLAHVRDVVARAGNVSSSLVAGAVEQLRGAGVDPSPLLVSDLVTACATGTDAPSG